MNNYYYNIISNLISCNYKSSSLLFNTVLMITNLGILNFYQYMSNRGLKICLDL